MFILLFQENPFWLIWTAILDLVMLILLYAKGELVVVYKDRYYGATTSNAFTDVTDLHFRDQE